MNNCFKIISIVGARPQFIKLAPVSRAFKDSGSFEEIVVHTGQHYDENMSDVFFSELEIRKPDVNLAVGSGSHAVQTARMLEGLEPIMVESRPDCVLIFGDTNSTLAAAVVAAKLHIPVAHVESGLRSFNRIMPEEINRIVADHLSDYLFAPTPLAVQNLKHEGLDPKSIIETGDVMYDAALFYGGRAASKQTIVDRLSLERKGYVLATFHRAENVDDPVKLKTICAALAEVAKDIPVVFPVHPRTKSRLGNELAGNNGRLLCIEPVGYIDMVALEANSALVATDSGGVQKEAYFHKVPCVTLRTETEWKELVETGWNTLAPPSSTPGLSTVLLSRVGTQGKNINLYGDGTAASIIANSLESFLMVRKRQRN
jgi:UDP-GlcNAc3NAcA epimerase